jgi:hypothetical protein
LSVRDATILEPTKHKVSTCHKSARFAVFHFLLHFFAGGALRTLEHHALCLGQGFHLAVRFAVGRKLANEGGIKIYEPHSLSLHFAGVARVRSTPHLLHCRAFGGFIDPQAPQGM